MELPRALVPWAAMLQLFPRELMLALGPMVRRLDTVIGPLRAQGRRGDGDPDGFDGLTRRGHYERLLLSEWLLAEEVPEEFVRRAAMMEHGFLHLARREPVGTRTSVALFDAGPNQIGAPRLAQLAALVVLARRAEAAGADFYWGYLQQPEMPLQTAITTGSMQTLLDARCLREATAEDIAAWRERLASPNDDLWFIGGKRLTKLTGTQNVSLLFLSDPLDPEQRILHADMRDRGRARPTATLELPDDALCVRLLRDPFNTAMAEPQRSTSRYVTPTSNLLFVDGGRRLLARSELDRLVVYPIPNSPNATPGKPKVHQTGDGTPILAAGMCGRGYAIITTTLEPDVLRLERVGPKGGMFPTGTFRLPPEVTLAPVEANTPLYTCTLCWDNEGNICWYLLLGRFLLRLKGNGLRTQIEAAELLATGVLACRLYQNYPPDWVARTDIGAALFVMNREQEIKQTLGFLSVLSGQVHNAYFGYATGDSLLVVEHGDRQWTVVYNYESQYGETLHSPFLSQVVGTVEIYDEQRAKDERYKVGLVLLDRDRRLLDMIGRDWSHTILRSSVPIVQASLSHENACLAYLTQRGELVVYDLQEKKALYRLETEGIGE